jgi:hypothetical protein
MAKIKIRMPKPRCAVCGCAHEPYPTLWWIVSQGREWLCDRCYKWAEEILT